MSEWPSPLVLPALPLLLAGDGLALLLRPLTCHTSRHCRVRRCPALCLPALIAQVFTAISSHSHLPSLLYAVELDILHRPDGSPHELGSGGFGKVCPPARPPAHPPAHPPACLTTTLLPYAAPCCVGNQVSYCPLQKATYVLTLHAPNLPGHLPGVYCSARRCSLVTTPAPTRPH